MNTIGDDNIAVGCGAGSEATTGSNTIYIGNVGVAGESDSIRIDPAIHHKAFIAGIPAGGLAAILFDYTMAPSWLVLAVRCRLIRRRSSSAQQSARPTTRHLPSTLTVFTG